MKRTLALMTIITLLLMSGLNVFADIGIPEGTRIQVTIKPQGANYYYNVDGDTPESAGKLDGGSEFYYIMGSEKNGYRYGTTDVNATDGETDKFFYVLTEDTASRYSEVSTDIGTQTAHTKAVTTDELNLRYGPGTGYEVKEVLPKDTEVDYEYTYDTDTTWMHVSYKDMEGWVSGDYLKTVSVETSNTEGPDNIEEQPEEEEGANAAEDNMSDTNQGTLGRGIFALIVFCILASAAIASVVTYMLLKKKNKDKEE